MLYTIKFNLEQFDSNDNELLELTSNTIILCKNSFIKRRIADEIMKLFDDINYEFTDYCYDDDDDYNIKVQYKPTTILEIFNKNNKYNQQRIIITTEAPFVLKCKRVCDLWFAQIDKDNKIHLYAFTDFIGHKNEWNKGVCNVYKKVISGYYGGFAYED